MTRSAFIAKSFSIRNLRLCGRRQMRGGLTSEVDPARQLATTSIPTDNLKNMRPDAPVPTTCYAAIQNAMCQYSPSAEVNPTNLLPTIKLTMGQKETDFLLNAEAGKEYFFRVSNTAAGYSQLRILTPMTEEQALYHMRDLVPLSSDNVKSRQMERCDRP